jgi:hypothetical protein
MDAISIISMTIGLMGVAGSFVFFILGQRQGKANKEILDNINNAIKEWQSKIIESAIEMIASRPEIIAKRTHLEDSKAKYDLLSNLSDRIQYIIEHLLPEENAKPQIAALNLLLETVTNMNKSTVPPEVWAKLAEQRKTQPGKTENQANQSPND